MRAHLGTYLDDFRRFGGGIAVVRMQGNRRRVTTYNQLVCLAGRFAALLEDRGIVAGDRVIVWAENSAEWIATFDGCLLRGVLAVPLDATGTTDFALRVAADVRPKLVAGDAALLVRLGDAWPTMAFEDWATVLPQREAAAIDSLGPDTPLQVLFTSGTTGDPKGIVHTHGNVLASVGPIEDGARPYMRYEKLVHPLRFLHTLPLSHVFGQTMGLWVPAIFAAEVHFESRLVAPRLVETIRRERINLLAAVPRVFGLIKAHLEGTQPDLAERLTAARGVKALERWWIFRDVHRLLGLRFWALISGGGALAGPLEQFWNTLGFVVVQGYGMTETTALITLNHPFHVARGTIGKPLPGREVKIGPDGEVLVRGPMISRATWSGGGLRQRDDEWLATGDMAEVQSTGELRFLGRKSEVIVTAAGVNIHPEDVEAALDQQPSVVASAVVAVGTPNGPEPFAALAVRGGQTEAAQAVEGANAALAEFQRVHRWAVWPEPDLPRTSTGKVRRKAVAAWVAEGRTGKAAAPAASTSDWLLALIAGITGETPAGTDDAQRLTEDLHLDSLGRVQLAAVLEQRLGVSPDAAIDRACTLAELRALFAGTERERNSGERDMPDTSTAAPDHATGPREAAQAGPGHPSATSTTTETSETFLYPKWPWWMPVRWLRTAFLECMVRPLVWFLANPRVVYDAANLSTGEPMLIVCNHVTAFDGPLIQYALPGPMRRRVAAMMAGEMLEDYRHFRNPERSGAGRRFMMLGPLAWLLLTALFNVFPLPRRRDFQRSFAHAGEALDRGYNVLVFPEGTRSVSGQLADFRPGIGLLVKQSHTAVLPVALRGLGELKAAGRDWFRPGTLEIHAGSPLRFAIDATEGEIAESLHAEVERLLKS
ncbi:MAG: AMP-binding protein [Terracidiphilus sp.]|nr:AMP-binding protein [Terracidiphilus sp.]